jgi:hypothetical protein
MMWAYLPESLSEALTSAQDRESALQHSALLDFAGLSSTLSETPTASDSSNNGSQTDGLTTPRCGTTQPHLTGDPGVDAWISSLAASRANRIPSQASAQEEPTSAIFGPTSGGSFARRDPESSCWRTYQACLALTEERQWDAYSGTWPRAGIVSNGECYPQEKWERRTDARESGYWPTPVASDWHSYKCGDHHVQSKGMASLRLNHWLYLHGREDLAHSPMFREWMMGLPAQWTDCAPLAMVGYRRWLQSLLDALRGG